MFGLPTVASLRRPEFTGDQRCWPCTVVNGAVVLVAAAAVAAVVHPAVGALAGVAGALAIWLRGYVVPGTPRFAPRLVARLPGGDALFHDGADLDGGHPTEADRGPSADGDAAGESAPGDRASGEGDRPRDGGSLGAATAGDAPEAGEAVLRSLVEAGAVEVGDDGVALAPAVADAYDEAQRDLAELSTGALAREVTSAVGAYSARAVRDDDTGREWIALDDGEHAVEQTWLRRPAVVADLAAVEALADHLPPDERLAAARSLRAFLERCPDCGTPLEAASAVACCGGYRGDRDVPAETRVCPDCEARLVTLD